MGENHAFACFDYIHKNPLRAGLVNAMEEWDFSSYRSYMKRLDDGITNHKLAERFGFWENRNDLTSNGYSFIEEDLSSVIR